MHLFLGAKGLPRERAAMAMIAARLPVVMAAIGIEATTVRVGGPNEQQRKRKAYSKPKEQRGDGLHGVAFRSGWGL